MAPAAPTKRPKLRSRRSRPANPAEIGDLSARTFLNRSQGHRRPRYSALGSCNQYVDPQVRGLGMVKNCSWLVISYGARLLVKSQMVQIPMGTGVDMWVRNEHGWNGIIGSRGYHASCQYLPVRNQAILSDEGFEATSIPWSQYPVDLPWNSRFFPL